MNNKIKAIMIAFGAIIFSVSFFSAFQLVFVVLFIIITQIPIPWQAWGILVGIVLIAIGISSHETPSNRYPEGQLN